MTDKKKNLRRWLISGAALLLVMLTVAYDRYGGWTVISTMHGETNYFLTVLGNHVDSPVRKMSPSNVVDVLETHTWNFTAINVGTLTVSNPATPAVIARDGAQVDVTNTTSEVVIFTNTLTAGIMGTNKAIRCKVFGRIFCNDTAITNFTIRVRFGGITNIVDATKQWSATSVYRPFEFEVWIANLNSASSQWASARLSAGPASSASNGGVGDFASSEANAQYDIVGNLTAVDTTAALGFSIGITPQGAGVNSLVKLYALLTLE